MRFKSVFTTITAASLGALWPSVGALAQAGDGSRSEAANRWIELITDKLTAMFSLMPALWAQLERVPAVIGAHPALLMLAMVLAGLAAEFIVRAACGAMRHRIFRLHGEAFSLRACLLVLLLDAVAFSALWATAHLISLQIGPKDTIPGQITHIVLLALLFWRAFNLIFRAWLRPQTPEGRIAPVDDSAARKLLVALNVVIALPMVEHTILKGLAVTGGADAIVSVASLLLVPLVAAALLAVVWYRRCDLAAWLAAMVGSHDRLRDFKLAMAKDWWAAGLLFYALVGCAAFYSALTEHLGTSRGLGVIESMAIVLLLFETLVYRLTRHLPAELPTLGDVVASCLRLAVRLVVLVVVVEVLFVDITGMSNANEWMAYSRHLKTAAVVVLLAYAAWRIVKYRMDSYIVANPLPVAGAVSDGDEDAPLAATRLRTLMPILRITFGVTIAIVGTLLTLAELDVNITPLIAGASVLGLAVSFGSQSLVKDIVSGMFFLAEDAFRVGEYIDCSRVMGTVEGFSVRSLRMRHQNGQLHIVPFGQVSHITNFSRDWTTVKFNLAFSRGTDVELLRRTTKKIGLDMMADPAYARELLAPLKMQGIVDIKDASLVIRFKFTARPRNPSLIQRAAIRRMYEAFPEKGIEFFIPSYAAPMVPLGSIPARQPAPPANVASTALAEALPPTAID